MAIGTCNGVCHFDSIANAARYQLFLVLNIVHTSSVALIGRDEHELIASNTTLIISGLRFVAGAHFRFKASCAGVEGTVGHMHVWPVIVGACRGTAH